MSSVENKDFETYKEKKKQEEEAKRKERENMDEDTAAKMEMWIEDTEKEIEEEKKSQEEEGIELFRKMISGIEHKLIIIGVGMAMFYILFSLLIESVQTLE